VGLDQNMEEDDKSEVNTSESKMIANSTSLLVQVYPTKEQGQKKTKMMEKSSKYFPHDNNSSYSYQSSSRLFQPYRTLGIITSGKGFYVQSAGTETFLIVPIGDRFQVLRVRLFVGTSIIYTNVLLFLFIFYFRSYLLSICLLLIITSVINSLLV
jgi:hypothetical protein